MMTGNSVSCVHDADTQGRYDKASSSLFLYDFDLGLGDMEEITSTIIIMIFFGSMLI